MIVDVDVIGQRIKIPTDQKVYVEKSRRFVKFRFNLSNDWAGLSCSAQFRQGDNAYECVLDNGCVYLPTEIRVGNCDMVLHGTSENVETSSEPLRLYINEDIFVADAEEAITSPSLYGQLMDKIDATESSVSALDTRIVEVETLKRQTKEIFVTPEMFGAAGDGVTDDYQAIQDCIDYAYEHNARVEFSRKTYIVSNTVKICSNGVYNGNNCTIRQTSDVPTMATYKYYSDTRGGYHATLRDFFLEGNTNNAGNDGLILCGWYIRVNHVNVQNVGGHGIVVTSYLSNGGEFSSSTHTMVEGMILNSKFRSTNPDKYPFYVHCSDSFMITDWRIENCIFASADCPCFMWFDRVAGWFLTDVQCYGNARNSGIYAHFASGTHMENITLDGIMYTGIYFGAQLGSCHATNVHIVVSAGVTGEIYAIRQTGGSSNPAALAIANIDVNVKSDTTPSALYLHRGSSYIFDVVNPVFVKDHAEISYQYFYYLGDNSVFRLNGFKILSNTPVNESTEHFSRHYSTVTYGRESVTLTLTITPSTTIDKAGLLLVAGEVNGASKGNSVYSVGLFHRSTVMPCQLISEQSGFEFTDVGVSYDSSTNTYTIVATTPNTDNCRYSMNVIF